MHFGGCSEFSRLLLLLVLCDCPLPLVSAYFTPVVVKVRDVTIRADREGISGYWTNGRHRVMLSNPNNLSPPPSPLPPPPPPTSEESSLPTTDNHGFYIPASKLVDYGFVELTIVSIDSDGEPSNVSIRLEQDTETVVETSNTVWWRVLLVVLALLCLLSLLLTSSGAERSTLCADEKNLSSCGATKDYCSLDGENKQHTLRVGEEKVTLCVKEHKPTLCGGNENQTLSGEERATTVCVEEKACFLLEDEKKELTLCVEGSELHALVGGEKVVSRTRQPGRLTSCGKQENHILYEPMYV